MLTKEWIHILLSSFCSMGVGYVYTEDTLLIITFK